MSEKKTCDLISEINILHLTKTKLSRLYLFRPALYLALPYVLPWRVFVLNMAKNKWMSSNNHKYSTSAAMKEPI